MQEYTDRRRFLALAGASGLAAVAGCFGDDEPSAEADPGDPDSGSDDGGDSGDGDADGSQPFDFPPGATENGIVTETVVAGIRQFVDSAGRHRIDHRQEADYSDAPTEELSLTHDVDDGVIHERAASDDVETDRWITPERTAGRSVDADAGRSGRWESETPDPTADWGVSFQRHPFETTSAAALVRNAALEFEGIVTEGGDDGDEGRSFARYTGRLVGSEGIELRQPPRARTDYRIESVSAGSVSIRLAGDGALHAVDYDFDAELTRLTHEERESITAEVSGEIRLEYDGLEPPTRPGWAAPDAGSDVRSFEFTETSLGRTYRLASGPPLPGTVDLEYTEFYLKATFGSETYLTRYSPRTEFDTDEGIVAWLEENTLQMGWASHSGRDAFVAADRLEIGVYLRSPGAGRSLVAYEEHYP